MDCVRPVTRRRFLRGAMAAAAVPLVLRSTAWAAGVTGPSGRITLGVIGVGWRGYYHVQHMVEIPEVQVVAVCDVVQGRRDAAKACAEDRYAKREAKGTFRGVAAYNDYRELLARDDIDAVMIATPDHWHAVQAIEAAQAGKDIYGEKPLSVSIREARAMVQAVRRYGRVFQTGTQQRSSWGCRFACEVVQSGRLGKLQKVTLNVGGPSGDCYARPEPVPKDIDWDLWLGPAPWHPYHAGVNPHVHFDFGGGSMTNVGAHYFDIVQWGLGADHTGPVETYPPDGKERPWLTFMYAGGVPVMNVTDRPENFTDGVVFHGTAGRIEATHDGYANAWPKSILRKPIGPDEVHLYNSPDPNPGKSVFGAQYGGYTIRHYTDWLRAIRSRQRPVADVEIGCRSATVCHLGNIAYRLNRALKWDPAKEQFVGDPEANRWLDRPMRPPWTL